MLFKLAFIYFSIVRVLLLDNSVKLPWLNDDKNRISYRSSLWLID